ncbi:alpha-amylase family protein [Pseudalkalibacillus caeni]|uniref:Amidase n=1 Tax=Exobacillus caeni TaxID=2574798 RepID=A0A5R9F8N8_9BACL|nr:alpha-amylase family protein [Pseudalkalibacillus caeni]TLS37213.1 hypothetical protein FCL54_11850 [Pseudalkalibacillus caeni]
MAIRKKKKVQWFALVCALIMVVAAFPTGAFAQTTSGKDKAMWAWFPNKDISTEEARMEMVDFAKEKGVNLIYLNIGEREGEPYLIEHPEQYRKLIKLAHENNIDVYALDGASEWAKEENYDIPISRMHDVFKYNRESKSSEQFDGIQFDIEPYLLDEWDTTERDQLIQEYLAVVKILNNIAKAYSNSHDFEFMIAMPFWFDGDKYTTTYHGDTKPLSDHVMDVVNSVVIMAYRDFAEGRDSILYHTDHEMKYASENGVKLVIGVETQYLEPYEKVSFFEEGETYMDEQLEVVDQIYADEQGYGGQAIHKYQSYKAMSN